MIFQGVVRRRLFLILGSILLVAAIVGVYSAFTLPLKIEEATTLVSYEHEARFDYLVYLKPSYLFGPEPEEPPPPPPPPPAPLPPSDLKYPTEIIDRFDLTFTYSFVPDKPVTGISEEVEVIAIVKRPDAEEKEITLVPKTSKKRDFTIDFTLDMTDEISGSDITINAYVYTTVETDTGPIFEAFTQSLGMRSEGPLLEVDGDLKLTEPGYVGGLNYEQQGEFDYRVRLKSDSPFGAITLKPPPVPVPAPPAPPALPTPPAKTIGPGEVIFSKLVDRMDATFDYTFKCDQPISELTEEVSIIATLENPEVWSKTFVLVPPTTKSESFSISFPLDIDHFTEMLEAIRSETGVPAESYNLSIKADVHTIAQTDFGPIDEVFSQTLSTALGKGTLEWNEELVESKPGSITTSRMIPNPNKYVGLSVNGIRILSAIVMGSMVFLFLYFLRRYMKFKPVEVPKIEKEIRLAKKKYGERMAEATSQTPVKDEKIISIGSMEDLIKVADELSKPVIHQAPSTPEEPHAYYVFDGATRYQYLLATGSKEQRSNAGKTE
ncbi:hypothetical protein ES704_02744 [subsurface metagenome]|jgi:hypothetical protein